MLGKKASAQSARQRGLWSVGRGRERVCVCGVCWWIVSPPFIQCALCVPAKRARRACARQKKTNNDDDGGGVRGAGSSAAPFFFFGREEEEEVYPLSTKSQSRSKVVG